MTRRKFVGSMAVLSAGAIAGCLRPTEPGISVGYGGRLNSRPSTPSSELLPAGLQPLGLAATRDGQVFIPSDAAPGEKFPLLLLLHGAGQSSAMWFGSYANRAANARFALLAPDSRGPTWDLLTGSYGPDVAFIDRALAHVFDRCAIDPARVAVVGFSDGASYSLAMGLTNGDLFRRVVAYSPGLLGGVDAHGSPRVLITHGVNDTVLPIDNASRRIVPILRRAGYDTTYGEFDGGHEVPQYVSDNAFEWLKGN